MIYIRWYGNLTKKQVNLDEDGKISASEVDDRRQGGAYTAYPETDVRGVIKIIDNVADDDRQELYKIIYDHILNSSRKNNRSYISVAVHCAEKMNLPGKKLYEDFEARYPVRIDYDAVDAYVKNIENFRARLKILGIKEIYDENFMRVWCDRYGEIVSVEEPNKRNKNGRIEYMKLPIVERAALIEMNNRDLEGIPYDYETMRNYSKRCKMLQEKLERQGIHRDVRKHIYCDSNGKEVSIQIPNYDDKSDYGSFSYVEKSEMEITGKNVSVDDEER